MALTCRDRPEMWETNLVGGAFKDLWTDRLCEGGAFKDLWTDRLCEEWENNFVGVHLKIYGQIGYVRSDIRVHESVYVCEWAHPYIHEHHAYDFLLSLWELACDFWIWNPKSSLLFVCFEGDTGINFKIN